jgi:arginine deiminase
MADNRSSDLSAQSNRSAAARETLQELHTKTDLTKKEIQKINEYTHELDRESVKSKYQLMKELEEEAHKKRVEDYKKRG